ncbi:MAG: MBL fold metallo-hydrolase [Chloroflexi bacterium]|nr:MBL fold metallo-hydrolase [Chloroflexota bacterium]
MIEKITWLGHASFKIEGAKRIYLDPWKLDDGDPADLILITHAHYDHLESQDVAKIQGPKTVIVTTKDCAAKLKGDLRVVKPGDRLVVEGVPIEVVPAYNIGKDFHPKAKGWVGYILTIDGSRIYHAGDTDIIPEMDNIECDIALLPVGGTYTMTSTEAAEAAKKVKAKISVPMHWGDIVGSRADAETFQKRAPPEVKILTSTRY